MDDAGRGIGDTTGAAGKGIGNAIDIVQWVKDKKWKSWMTPNNMLIGLLLGVLLLVIALPTGAEDTDKNESSGWGSQVDGDVEEVDGSISVADTGVAYGKRLEQEFAGILANIAGVNSVQVMITLESSGEAVLNKDNPYIQNISSESGDGSTKEQTGIENKEETILLTKDGDSYPYVVKEIYPKVEGVLVLIDGEYTATLRNEIIGVAEVLFGVEAHKVKVLEMEDKGDYR